MAATKGDVLAYLQGLSQPSQINKRLLTGHYTGWPGGGAPDLQIPAIKAMNGNVTPAIIGAIWGEGGQPEDAAHWTAGDNLDIATEMPDAIAGLIDYWNEAGCLPLVFYASATPTGSSLTLGPYYGRYDTTVGGQPANPQNMATILSGAAVCKQWRQGVLVENLTFNQVLDYHAAHLQQLKDAGVVVIYRPWAEFDVALKLGSAPDGTRASWYLMLTAADFIAMWQYVYTYLTVTKGLTNMLWMWSALEPTSGTSYYPGADYVDIIAWSYYAEFAGGPGSWPLYTTALSMGKIIMLGEYGLNPSGNPHDVNATFEAFKAGAPMVVGAPGWPDPYGYPQQTNLVAAFANPWVQNAPVPVLELAPVASFNATPVPGSRTIQFEDTSV